MTTAELVKLNNLKLVGKLISDRVLLGSHLSKRLGSGLEFEQYRSYFPGDDLKNIDWKLYARTGKFWIKESANEGNLNIRLILDLSGSMNYEEGGISRIEYGKILLASLAYMAYRQGDALSFYTLKNGKLEVEVTSGNRTFQKILYRLEEAKAGGGWSFGQYSFPELKTGQKELIILVSDLLQTDDEWLEMIRNTVSPNKQIMIFQLLGRKEVNMDFDGFYRFKDLETGKEVELNTVAIRNDYTVSFGKYLKSLEREFILPNVTFERVYLDEEIGEVLKRSVSRLQM